MEWIKCSERLPEEDVNILAFDSDICECVVVQLSEDLDSKSGESGLHWFCSNGNYNSSLYNQYITHWMPLPETPEED